MRVAAGGPAAAARGLRISRAARPSTTGVSATTTGRARTPRSCSTTVSPPGRDGKRQKLIPNTRSPVNEHDISTTFFVVGSRVISRPQMVQAEYMAGHQIAVHTWAHPPLTTLTNEQIVAELGWSKQVIKQTIGVTPLYMRPPYGDIDDRVRAICKAMTLTPIIWTRTNTM